RPTVENAVPWEPPNTMNVPIMFSIMLVVNRLVHLLPKTKLLNEEWFDNLDDARRKLALWRYDYKAQLTRACIFGRHEKQIVNM
ncbi:hypothetical protein, partial [uncultured Ruegeria sp.]|uniref:hypothetical protein n=1 Tax=uncultured Ruegeria sp. TaxID=259304 RepID=UPI0026336EB5